jgi:prepilin-type processing-associated H-X9-DG protein
MYAKSADGRSVSARLSHRRPSDSDAGRPWQLRATDFDTAGHVNNAIAWAAVEDLVAREHWQPGHAEVEYHRPMLPGCEPRLVAEGGELDRAMWLMADGHVLASATVAA